MAVSASRARYMIQYFSFKERLYFRPLYKSAVSSSENTMSVLFMILGEKLSWEFVLFCL